MIHENKDSIQGDKIAHDKIGRDQIEVGDIDGVSAVGSGTVRIETLVQQIFASGQRNIAQPPYQTSTRIEAQRLYFHLSLVPSNNDGGNSSLKLEPGQKYFVQAYAETDPHPEQNLLPITFDKDIELYLECQHEHVLISAHPYVFPYQNTPESVEFEIEVDSAYLGGEVTFALTYRKQGSFTNPISTAKLKLEGSPNHDESPVTRLNIDLGTQPREEVRILHIQPAAQNQIHLYAYWNEKTEFESCMLQPTLSPAPLMDAREPPSEIIGRVRSHSANMDLDFLKWLKSNLKEYGREFCIILCDNTEESNMAWEMMHVNIEPGDLHETPPHLTGAVPIGALIAITRWLPNIRWFDRDHVLQISRETTEGNVLSYLDHEDIGHTQREQEALSHFDVESHHTISDFKERLQGQLDEVGLIYLACHGIIVNRESERTMLLGKLQTREQIKVYELAAILEYLQDIPTRPVVMINACYSALLFQQNGLCHGLAEVMLQNIARDFIGTIGRVGTERAAKITQSLFKPLDSQNELCIAVALRDLRAEMVRRHRARELSREFWEDYLYTFLYVHYGNPYTKLRLHPAKQPPTGEDSE